MEQYLSVCDFYLEDRGSLRYYATLSNPKKRYVGLVYAKGFNPGVIKTKRVWVSLLDVQDEDDFNWLLDSGVLRDNKLNNIIK